MMVFFAPERKSQIQARELGREEAERAQAAQQQQRRKGSGLFHKRKTEGLNVRQIYGK
jgi:hypothetical protein